MKKVIPSTCPDFVSHPHLIDGRGCYTCQTSLASDEQGTSALAIELQALGIPCDVHQTGGFTMCVYIKTGEASYVYANDEGFSFYRDENCDGWSSGYFTENEIAPSQKAKAVQISMGVANLHAQNLD